MGQRECGVGAGGGRGGDTRDDFERNTMGGEMVHLFAETTEDTRVATFEAHDETALARLAHDHGVDLILRHRVDAAALADRHNLRASRNLRQEGIPREGVMNHHVGLFQQTESPDGDQVRSPGACTDKDHPADVTIYHLFKLDPYICNPNSSYQVLNQWTLPPANPWLRTNS